MVRALAKLPERQRAVYIALARDGLTYEALTERFGVGVDEIERDFAAALATLADAIDAPAVPRGRRFIRGISRKGSK
nr:sigma-70 region 4 domain-containing protein [Hephaestia mangrovi]